MFQAYKVRLTKLRTNFEIIWKNPGNRPGEGELSTYVDNFIFGKSP